MPVTAQSAPLAAVIDSMTVEGAPELTEHLDAGALKCYACGHRCLIKLDKRGICKVRFNEGGHLRVPANYVAALACDPTERNRFSTCCPDLTRLPSECWVATCIARTARTGSRRKHCATIPRARARRLV